MLLAVDRARPVFLLFTNQKANSRIEKEDREDMGQLSRGTSANGDHSNTSSPEPRYAPQGEIYAPALLCWCFPLR
ncbi:hypothetical protein ACP_2128 [Acidobacterium capsulatum ATCC 51196]|uniref:Uncharacterized protein n=1 Tax=Acidobacterium capsulatum (strain ATCC 51196 / DSM 11244 / BCRC 80197 / JCM 7670 / NBRC 15755 / NCIMB 13165 / 161) TaxID=240015 RepID=C1F9H1_ACIC5|nr:hypothetical protein ACP_2128 [Acidobacterium capsulatum ATCC 51196]